MNDQQLAEVLLAGSPDSVLLLGKSVFRVEAALLSAIGDSPLVIEKHCLTGDPSSDDSAGVEAACEKPALEFQSRADTKPGKRVTLLGLPPAFPAISPLLGALCRHSPGLVLVEHSGSPNASDMLADEQFFAFGFRVLEKSVVPDGQRSIYAFRLSDYKQAPDWLNARFWAHPERFELPE